MAMVYRFFSTGTVVHLTKFGQTISERANINASVVKGSALGPIFFNVNS